MEQDLNALVDDSRRRLGEQADEVGRLAGAVAELEGQAAAGVSKEAGRALRRARRDLARARSALDTLKRQYARVRLGDALGDDPAHVERELFDEELLAMTEGSLARGESRGPRDGRIGFEAFRELLLADLDVEQLIENERADRQAALIIDELHDRTATKPILRRWAARLQSDPYVADLLGRAGEEAARFTQCLNQFTHGLNDVRVNYEISKREVDELTFIVQGGEAAIRAANRWDHVAELFPQECDALLASYLALEQACAQLRALHDELNAEIRAFTASFVPRYITYLTRQSAARRRRLALGSRAARRLCAYLLDEADRTDFLLPHGGGIEMAVPRIPKQFAAFRKMKAFREYKKSLQRAELSQAPTLVAGDGP